MARIRAVHGEVEALHVEIEGFHGEVEAMHGKARGATGYAGDVEEAASKGTSTDEVGVIVHASMHVEDGVAV